MTRNFIPRETRTWTKSSLLFPSHPKFPNNPIPEKSKVDIPHTLPSLFSARYIYNVLELFLSVCRFVRYQTFQLRPRPTDRGRGRAQLELDGDEDHDLDHDLGGEAVFGEDEVLVFGEQEGRLQNEAVFHCDALRVWKVCCLKICLLIRPSKSVFAFLTRRR